MKYLKLKINSLLQKSLFKDTAWMMIAQIIGLFLQMAYFMIVARALGLEQYGIFSGVLALAFIATPFSGLGSGDILVQNVSRDPTVFRKYWGNSILIIFVTSLILSTIAVFVSPLIFHQTIAPILVFLVCFSDLFFLRVWLTASGALVSRNLTSKAAQIKVFHNFSKLLAALILVSFFKQPTIFIWGCLYLLGTATSAMLSFLLVCRMLGLPTLDIKCLLSNLTPGFFFSLSSSATTVNAHADKLMLASLSTLEATGTYAAAYRFIDVGYFPFFAISSAAYARFFKEGATGIKGSLGLAKRLLPVISGYGVIATIGYLVFAPVVTLILGEEYRESAAVLRWMAPFHLLFGFQYLAADTLTGAGLHKWRSFIQVFAALLNVLLNFWLIPLYSWKGAAWATIASITFQTLGLWLLVIFFSKQEVINPPKEGA
ncbi:polysaccharide biosynthesis family protein [Lyngbya aestuarii BL J]|uniref:Polysaccharide biosynthesis family protein n=1 Tax=Lyngbya aestuarii BL J TaxID=1348334 RepID=U7QF04_9CYAN|nr:flippase [Lyngbya aestuarii]ERT05665.1 polysaccharide biosynthesis family protein [Lyngbya aestuarii BL J]